MELPNAVGVLEKEALALSSRLQSCCEVKEKIIRRFIRLKSRIEAPPKKGKEKTLKRWPSWRQEPNQKREKEQCPNFNIKQPQNSWQCFRAKPASLPLYLPVSGKHHCSTNYQNIATVVSGLSSSKMSVCSRLIKILRRQGWVEW